MRISIQGFTIGIPLLIYFIWRGFNLAKRGKAGEKFHFGREVMNTLVIGYIAFIISITLFPIYLTPGEDFKDIGSRFLEKLSLISLVPFKSIIDSAMSGFIDNSIIIRNILKDVIGNLIMLSPIVVYLCFYNERLRSIKNVLMLSFIISFGIETLQLIEDVVFIHGMRNVDATDLFLNTMSGIIGYAIYLILRNTKLNKMIDGK